MRPLQLRPSRWRRSSSDSSHDFRAGRGGGRGSTSHAERVTAEGVADDVIEPASAPVREPVYRLRKAGTAEPEPTVAAGLGEGRDALDRLREFFGDTTRDGMVQAYAQLGASGS